MPFTNDFIHNSPYVPIQPLLDRQFPTPERLFPSHQPQSGRTATQSGPTININIRK